MTSYPKAIAANAANTELAQNQQELSQLQEQLVIHEQKEAIANTGLLVPASRPEQMAEAILKLLLMGDEERSQYGKKALERSLKLFTQDTFLAKHREVYHQLLVY